MSWPTSRKLVQHIFFVCFVYFSIGEKCRINVHDTLEYIGCFVDTERMRLLPYRYNKAEPVDIESHSELENSRCLLHCRDAAYMYAGTQIGKECFCGNNPWAFDADDVDYYDNPYFDCNYKCLGDASQICGGGYRLTVYDTGLTNDTNVKHLVETLNKKLSNYKGVASAKKLDDQKRYIASKSASMSNCAALCSSAEECTGFVYLSSRVLCTLYNMKLEDLCDYSTDDVESVIYLVQTGK